MDHLRGTVWKMVSAALGIGVMLGLAWLGQGDPLRSTSEITVAAGNGQSQQAQDVLADMFASGMYRAEALIPSSADHVAVASLGDFTTNVYVYDSVFEDVGAVRCTLSLTRNDNFGGGGSGCPLDAQSTPYVGWGSTSDGSGISQHTATILWGHDDAQWAIFVTASGKRIKANVVEGATIAMWSGAHGDQLEMVTLFDRDAGVLWAERHGSVPPVPGAFEVNRAVEAAAEAAANDR